jgi:hypothetical protein
MRQPVIGVVGPRYDDEVLLLTKTLRRLGARPRVLDFTGLPAVHSLEIRGSAVFYDGRDLAAIDAVYIRRFRLPSAERALVEAARESGDAFEGALDRHLTSLLREREIAALIWSALSLLRAPLINGLEEQLVHPRKLCQLRLLAAAGLPVPETLVTNDPEAIERFVERLGPSSVVIKPVRGLLKTRRYDPSEELGRVVLRRPIMAQQYVEGTTVRVYAVAGEVVAAAALSNQGHVDSSVDPLPARLVELEPEERELVRRSTLATNLSFTGMDLIRPLDGGGAFVLECNAAPMFANFCRRTGADVATPLAEHLMARASDAPEKRFSSPPF